MPDEKYVKKHKVNSKKECAGSACVSERPRRTIRDIFNNTPDTTKENIPFDKPVKPTKYEEKVGYQSGTAKAGEPIQEKPEVIGRGMTKEERDKEQKKYKTRY